MGTRADFYIGRGNNAEWLGSIGWDGYPDGLPGKLIKAKTEEKFRNHVENFLAKREDATKPEMGWPWPWNDSRTTDYAYAFDDGQVHASCFGHEWFDPTRAEPESDDDDVKVAVFPDMTDQQNVALGNRSGLIVLRITR